MRLEEDLNLLAMRKTRYLFARIEFEGRRTLIKAIKRGEESMKKELLGVKTKYSFLKFMRRELRC